LLRHGNEGGDPSAVVERALCLLVDDLERRRMAQVKQPRLTAQSHEQKSGVRYVPAPIRREVWQRDGGQCAFVGRRRRCRETGALELHHVVPFALGGPTSVANLELRCRAHNQYEGSLLFGDVRGGVSDRENPNENGTRSGAS
jgi:5-methylcytosine-specific restriction endonuclease McrA